MAYNITFKKIIITVGSNKWRLAAWITALIFFSYFLTLSVLDHQGFRTQLNDLGHMEQAMWSLTQGDMLMTSSSPIPGKSRLFVHANLIFYFLAPVYAAFSGPYTLFAIACAAVALGSIVIFNLAYRFTNNGFLAWLFGFLLLFNPMVHDAVLFDFHPIILTVIFVPLLFHFLETKKWTYYWIILILLLTVKENTPFLVFMLSPFVFIRHSKRQGILTAITALIYWMFIRWILPIIIGTPVAAYMLHRFQTLGSNPEEIVVFLIKNPFYILQKLSHTEINYLIYLLLQGGYLAIFAPLAVLPALPTMIINLSAFNSWQAQPVGTYYHASIVTILLIGSLYGYVKIKQRHKKTANLLLGFMTTAIIIQGTLLTPAPHGLIAKWADFAINKDYDHLQQIKQLIPDDASVASQNNIAAHLAAREEIYSLKQYRKTQPDYVLLHLANPVRKNWSIFFSNRTRTYLKSPNNYRAQVASLTRESNYKLIKEAGDLYLFRRMSSTDNNNITASQQRDIIHKLNKLNKTKKENLEKIDFSATLEHNLDRLLYK